MVPIPENGINEYVTPSSGSHNDRTTPSITSTLSSDNQIIQPAAIAEDLSGHPFQPDWDRSSPPAIPRPRSPGSSTLNGSIRSWREERKKSRRNVSFSSQIQDDNPMIRASMFRIESGEPLGTALPESVSPPESPTPFSGSIRAWREARKTARRNVSISSRDQGDGLVMESITRFTPDSLDMAAVSRYPSTISLGHQGERSTLSSPVVL